MKKFKWCGDKLYSSAVTGSETCSAQAVLYRMRGRLYGKMFTHSELCYVFYLILMFCLRVKIWTCRNCLSNILLDDDDDGDDVI